MDIRALSTLDEARALVDCVYAVYGLTFHRDYVYRPEQMLELNRSGLVRSFLAFDGGRVIGHLAFLRPFFELQRGGVPLADPGIGEVGLSVVLPDAQHSGVQSALGHAMFRWAKADGKHSAMMKCVTNHTYSQRSGLAMGARPLALFLAGVPQWVAHPQAGGGNDAPISTMLLYLPLAPASGGEVRPPRGVPWLGALVAGAGLGRGLAEGGPAEEAPTDLEVEFQPAKRLAQVHVLQAGPDLAVRLDALNRWLIAGHMAHVSYFLPAASAQVQAQAPALAEAGLFPAGWVPQLHAGGADAWVYSSLGPVSVDPAGILTHGDAGAALRDAVVAGWRAGAPGPAAG